MKNFKCNSWLKRIKFRKEIKQLSNLELEKLIDKHKENEFLNHGFLLVMEDYKVYLKNLNYDERKEIIKNYKDAYKQYKHIKKRNKIIYKYVNKNYRKTNNEFFKNLKEQLEVEINDDLFKATQDENYIYNAASAVGTMLNESIKNFNSNPTKESLNNAKNEISKIFNSVLKTKKEKNYFYAMLILVLRSYVQETGLLSYDFVFNFLTSNNDELLS